MQPYFTPSVSNQGISPTSAEMCCITAIILNQESMAIGNITPVPFRLSFRYSGYGDFSSNTNSHACLMGNIPSHSASLNHIARIPGKNARWSVAAWIVTLSGQVHVPLPMRFRILALATLGRHLELIPPLFLSKAASSHRTTCFFVHDAL